MSEMANWVLSQEAADQFLARAKAHASNATRALLEMMTQYTELTPRQRVRLHHRIHEVAPATHETTTKNRVFRLPEDVMDRFDATCDVEMRIPSTVVESLMSYYLHCDEPGLNLRGQL